MRNRQLLFGCAFAIVVSARPALATEVCGNGVDDDADGAADDGCYPTLTTGQCESPLSCSETGMVSPSTGSLRYSLPPDVAPRVPWGPGIGLRRFYLSQYAPGTGAPAYKTPLGERWGHTYTTWLEKTGTPPSSKIVLHTNRGQDVLATYSATVSGWDEYTFQTGFHVQKFRQRTTSPFEYELKALTGETYVYNSQGRLTEIRDTYRTPHTVTVTYDANSQVSTVTDASGKRRLKFNYTSSRLTKVEFQLYVSSVWTTYQWTDYAYTNGNLTSVSISNQLVQSNSYTNNYLTQINDGGGKTIITFAYDAATAGKAVRADTKNGTVGWEYASSRTGCTGKTLLYFNRSSTASCSVDSDCGSGFICGGKTGTGSTGVCFHAARCLTVQNAADDVVTSVTAISASNRVCQGTCLDAAQYVWNTTGLLELKAIQDPSGNYTAHAFNANGLPTRITYGDPDSDPSNTNAAREVFLFYDTTFPGRVSEMRWRSELWNASPCTATDPNYCARRIYTYDADGMLTATQESGSTIHTTGSVVALSRYRSMTYDKGRLTQVDGASPVYDKTVFTYHVSTDPLLDGFLSHVDRYKDFSNYLRTQATTYDFWGNPTTLVDANSVRTCLTFDSGRGYLKQRRIAMAAQTSCSTTNSADITTSWDRDTALRLTKLTQPDGSCLHHDYDTRGRLSATKRRDDCNAASSGDREEYTYSAEGLLTKIETFDASGTVTRRKEMTYFDSRRLEKLINPVDTSKWTGFVYDNFGLVSEVNGGGNLSKTVYDRNADQRVTTEKRYTTSSAFDSWNLLYDWLGNTRKITDGTSLVTEPVRNDFGQIAKLASPDLGGYPTIFKYDDALMLTTHVERQGGTGSQTHVFSYDKLFRTTSADYHGWCPSSNADPEIQYTYDAPPVTCPITGGCNKTQGRLAYVKVTLLCSTAYADATLDQETFYSYDDAGRVIREYIRDDSGRVATHEYTWTKNGEVAQTKAPSGTIFGATFGSAGSNSDTDRISALWRGSTATPIINTIAWYPYGPFKQYNQMNTSGSVALMTRVLRNLAYRTTETRVLTQTGGTTIHSVVITEDAKGRVTARDYTPNTNGVQDSYFLYDLSDRVLCETTSLVSSCPSSGANIKNSHTDSPPFTAAGDWKMLKRPIAGSTGLTNDFTLNASTHQIGSVIQSDGTPTFGTTAIGHDGRGNRSYDDNTSTLTNDRRDYTYDARRNVVNVQGKYYAGGVWDTYNVVSAFDAKNRRV